MKKLVLLSAAFVLFFVAAKSASADQYGPYQGPQPNLSIMVDKFVGVPSQNSKGEVVYSYVDNLGVNDFKFKGDDYVFFKIKVKNTSNTQIDNVVIKDYAPAFIDLFDNPGTFDSTNRVLTINVGSLAANAENEYIVRARVTNANNITAGITCVVNKAVASNDKVSDDDTAQLCIEKTVLGTSVPATTKIPSTGPEAGMAILPLSALLGWVGMKLRKTS